MKKLDTTITGSEDYKNMINLLAVLSEASNRMDELQAGANGQLLEILDDQKSDYAKLQSTITQADAALELIARSHPEWFTAKQSIKTPYGTVKFHSSTVLQVKNEEASIILIQDEARTNPDFKPSLFIKKAETLDREALERLDDATLERLRIKRVPKSNFSAVPAKLDMGKAVKEAVEKEAA